MIYPNFGYTIPYFWMPKYVNANDASARSLEFYNDNNNNNDNNNDIDTADSKINISMEIREMNLE